MTDRFYTNTSDEPYGEPFPLAPPGEPRWMSFTEAEFQADPRNPRWVSGDGTSPNMDQAVHYADPGGDELEAANHDFLGWGGEQVVSVNVAGLSYLGEPGTAPNPQPMAELPYTPGAPEIRGSMFAQYIRPTYHVALNDNTFHLSPGDYSGGSFDYEVVQPAVNLALIQPEEGMGAGGVRSGRTRPAPLFLGKATAWPRVQPRWQTLGDE